MIRSRPLPLLAATLVAALFAAPAAGQPLRLLNASYDPTRELYQELNATFAREWTAKTGQTNELQQSHGGSGKLSRAFIYGL